MSTILAAFSFTIALLVLIFIIAAHLLGWSIGVDENTAAWAFVVGVMFGCAYMFWRWRD